MSTARQRTANKLNAQNSTGPTSPEGRAKSSLNRLSHGFASSATIMPGENPEEFKALLDSLTAEHEPQGPTEQILVEHLAMNQWLSLRAFRLQGFAFLHQQLNTDDKFSMPKDLALLIRYKTTSDNAFHKAHNDLVKTQKERKNSEIGFEPQSTSAEPEIDPKIVPITAVETDFEPETAAPAGEFAFSDARFLKKAV